METLPQPPQRLPALLDGTRATLPLLGGTIPFGLIYGVAARGAHVAPWLTQAMSVLIFAGSAQFAVVQLVAVGAPAAVLVLTGVILNLRHLLYSAALAPTVRRRSGWWRVALAYLLTDEMFGVATARLRAGLAEQRQPWYALGAGMTLWVCWQASTLAGLLVGGEIPVGWSLDFAATLTFIALVVPMVRDRASLWSALVAGVVVLGALHAPLRLGLLAAALAGVLAGVLAGLVMERHTSARGQPRRDAARPGGHAHPVGTGSTSPSPRDALR